MHQEAGAPALLRPRPRPAPLQVAKHTQLRVCSAVWRALVLLEFPGFSVFSGCSAESRSGQRSAAGLSQPPEPWPSLPTPLHVLITFATFGSVRAQLAMGGRTDSSKSAAECSLSLSEHIFCCANANTGNEKTRQRQHWKSYGTENPANGVLTREQ